MASAARTRQADSLDYSRFDKVVSEDDADRAQLLDRPTRFDHGEAEAFVPLDEMHASDVDVRECRALEQRPQEVWQVAVLKLRCWVGASASVAGPAVSDAADSSIPVRPYTLFVACLHPSGKLLTRYVARPPETYPSPHTVMDHLMRAMMDPQGPGDRETAHRPGIVTFADPALASHCARTLAGIGVQTSVLSAAPGLHGYVRGLSGLLVQREIGSVSKASEQDGMAAVRGVTPQLLRGFFRLARVFAAAQPWRQISESQCFRLWRSDGRALPGDTFSHAIEGGEVAWVAVMGALSAAAQAERAARKEGRLRTAAARQLRTQRYAARQAERAAAAAAKAAGASAAARCGTTASSAAEVSGDDEASSFHSLSSAGTDEGGSDKEGRDAEADEVAALAAASAPGHSDKPALERDGSESGEDADAEIAQTRGICVFFSRHDAERRLLSGAAGDAVRGSAGSVQPRAAVHPLDSRCAHCGRWGAEYAAAAAAAAGSALPAALERCAVAEGGDAAKRAAELLPLFAPPEAPDSASVSAGLRLQRCGRCKRALYCDAACQRGHYASHAAQCKRDAVSDPMIGGRSWGERELVLLLEAPPSLPFDDLDWYDSERLATRREREALAAGGVAGTHPVAAADVCVDDAFYPADLPLALTFHRGAPARPSPRDLCWLMRAMVAVLRMTQGPAVARAGDAASRSAEELSQPVDFRPLVRLLSPTLRPASLNAGCMSAEQLQGPSPLAANPASDSRQPEAWYTAAGEGVTPPSLLLVVDPILPAPV
jgi:hypothetical protein